MSKFSSLNMFVACMRNMAMLKLIPVLCIYVYLYMFSTVHPPGCGLGLSHLSTPMYQG